jgi:hypothetical protein
MYTTVYNISTSMIDNVQMYGTNVLGNIHFDDDS